MHQVVAVVLGYFERFSLDTIVDTLKIFRKGESDSVRLEIEKKRR